MKWMILIMRSTALAVLLGVSVVLPARMTIAASGWTVVGWNNLGMHCMDADYSVFSLLPPYNTIHAQLIDPQGRLVTDPSGISVTYEAVADLDGSINRSSLGKTNFWDHVQSLFGVALPGDVGLLGKIMPGATNESQAMSFDSAAGWFIAEGIPITPYDDAGHKNPYPLMRLAARQGGTVLATTDIVLPVSDEMDCRSCHASGGGPAALPIDGWVFDSDPQRDMRLNILRLHDDRTMIPGLSDAYQSALAAKGYNIKGLFATVSEDGKAVLCASCHLSEALRGSGISGLTPLTQAMHGRMAYVIDPLTNLPLDATENRSACYRCHPGSVTRCLRGVMGAAVAPDGTRAIQCQSCHGSMIAVASPDRTGWLNEPTCQSCHTGTAVSNNGQIRYTSAFEDTGQPRVAVDTTFATTPDVPAAGLSLYRFSKEHGGLACEACHGSTHAEFASSHRNDNVQSIQHQGHVGVFIECASCHGGQQPVTVDGGPHGMHPVGQEWVNRHPSAVGEGEGGGAAGATQCQRCHGQDYRGTVLSRAKGDRTLSTEELGTKQFWRGFQIGCYTCHQGPSNGDRNPNRAAAVLDASIMTTVNTPAHVNVGASDADGNSLALRVVSQPEHGTAAVDGTVATYFPDNGFTGADTFTFAAWDGSTDSNLGTVTVEVAPSTCAGDCDGSNAVTPDDLLAAVTVAMGHAAPAMCMLGDQSGNGQITVDEILVAVNHAVSSCAAP
jgi:hypothetical protein